LPLSADKIIKLLSAIMLFGICMAFRNDVSESWLRIVIAAVACAILAWGIGQMFVKPK